MHARTSPKFIFVLLLIGVFPCARLFAQANIAVRAGISQEKMIVGETLLYTIEIDSDSQEPVSPPANPDFGGLQVIGAPRTGQRISIINGIQQVSFSYAFPLTATQPGTYVIPPIIITAAGQTYQTESYTVQVLADSLDAFPPTLQKEAILNPRSGDAGINQQLRGRLCLVPKVSDIQPFVGEPFVMTFVLYVEEAVRSAIQDYSFIAPKSQDLLGEEIVQSQAQKSFRVEEVDGRRFNVVDYYETVFTPTKSGETVIDGFGVRLQLVVRSGSSFFSNTLAVDVMSGPIKINVRSLPDAGRPPNFNGTVGEYKLEGTVDRTAATLEDIITLSVKISGRGNIAQAAAPTLPSLDDFELFDQTQDVQKNVTSTGIVGTKSVEFLLRPRRAENLTVPALEYSVFDPASETYRTLTAPSATVSVSQSGGIPAIPSSPADGSGEGIDDATGLRYIKPLVDVSLRPSPLIMERPLYWLVQLTMIGLAGWAYLRSRRMGRMDPIALRRLHAHEGLQRGMLTCGQCVTAGRIEDGALALERALREFVGDLQNCSPEGLTGEEVAERLSREGLDPQSGEKIRRALDFCSSIRYAPVGSAATDLKKLMDETALILSKDKLSS